MTHSRFRFVYLFAFFALLLGFYSIIQMKAAHIVRDSVTFIDRSMNTIVSSDYKEKEVKTYSLGYLALTDNQKNEIVMATRSLVDNNYYELGNTLYKIKLTFTKTSLTLEAIPIYNLSILNEFVMSDATKGTDEKFIQNLQNYIQQNYRYFSIGYSRRPLTEFLESKQGKCDDYAELFYLLAKKRGMDARIQVNEYHAWNIVKIGGMWRKVDLTANLPLGGDTFEK